MLELLSNNWPVLVYLALLAFALLVALAFFWPDAAVAGWVAFADLSRGAPLLLVFALAFAVVLDINPAKWGLAFWGVGKIALCAYLGYWVDRLCFRPEDRPHVLTGIARGTAWKRRALIIAAAILAGGMLP